MAGAVYFVRVLEAWTRKLSCQAQGIVRSRVVVEVNVAVAVTIAIGVWAGIVWRGWNRETACPLDFWRKTFGGSLVRNARFGDLTRDFWRKSRTKRFFLQT